MKKIWTKIRHNPGIVISTILVTAVLLWVYGCHSQVTSITNSPKLVSRSELEVEVDHFLKNAEIRFKELDQQDEFKRTIFAVAINFMKTGQINPLAIALTLGNMLGIGLAIDNVKKGTHIKTLKGGNANAEVKKTIPT